MQYWQSVTKGILKRVEEVNGKSIQFMRDDNLAVLSTLQLLDVLDDKEIQLIVNRSSR